MGQRGRKKGASGEQSRALLLKIAADELPKRAIMKRKLVQL
ncbi:hypothetical protein HNP81_002258 [Peribacillus huizhouensis]|uniref:Uncharacterized protein n=1 Tax=Peribacillus huizhouensis TaxID=1501239 RepID=A0ABR6CPM2_9BACI|nr:hypothetical protein [Bacillus cihuensis]MBA9026973.1 hypothetical protein [Peribacillus huizhouensis]